jgi:hypothetical protein
MTKDGMFWLIIGWALGVMTAVIIGSLFGR